MSAEPQPKPKTPDEISLETQRPESREQQRQLELELAILDELKRMNRLLYAITYGPRRYTLAFFSGIVRGLGALLGATVVFALLIGLLSRLDTVPLIGTYVKEVLTFVQSSMPSVNGKKAPAETPAPTGTPGP